MLNRLTTDHPDGNLSTLLNFAYAKDRRVVLSYADEENMDLCDYISRQSRQHGCDVSADDVMEGSCDNCDCPLTVLYIAATQAAELRGRLKMIEDILGDTYDLDHLRELVEDERNGRLFLTPVNPGDSVYWLLEDDGWYISDPEIVADVGTKGFYLSGVRDSVEPGDNPSFVPWDEMGKSVFLSQEDAEAALAKMKEEV